jgi:hypothetical protein
MVLIGVVILVLLHTASLAILRIVHRETNSTLAKTQQKLDKFDVGQDAAEARRCDRRNTATEGVRKND